MKFEKLAVGMTVYDVGKTQMGNTTIKTVSVWPVRIVSIDEKARSVVASWNFNKPQTFYRRSIEKWREKEPVLIRSEMGRHRIATREEQKEMKQKKADLTALHGLQNLKEK